MARLTGLKAARLNSLATRGRAVIRFSMEMMPLRRRETEELKLDQLAERRLTL